jgi:deoxyribodipyrimidine photo-lyase
MSRDRRTIVWLRGDLRIDDNPALAAATRRGDGGCVAVFVATPGLWDRMHWGPARRAMVIGGVAAMRTSLSALGVPLVTLEVTKDSEIASALAEVARSLNADEVHTNREFGVWEDERDERVASGLAVAGCTFVRHEDQTILPVREIRSGSGTPYTVFTPFKKRWLATLAEVGIPELAQATKVAAKVDLPRDLPHAVSLDDLVARQSAGHFTPGEAEPRRRVDAFLAGPIERYHDDRDPPALDGTSTISPWLACGSISPRRLLHDLVERFGDDPGAWREGPATWLSELIWREFYRHAMDGIRRLSMDRPLHGWTDRVTWREADDDFTAWCEGRTGIAIVDAGMKQLAATGWMHNRVRMIVATFLSKHLLIDWRRGERFFMESLADADFPSNNGGWQWAASTGTDAAPYFRVFNPDTQRERFDARNEYVRRWAPEHLDGTAPKPLVDLKKARVRAIEAFKAAKNATA